MKSLNYHEQQIRENETKLRNVIATLPSFCKEFFLGIEHTTSARTKLAYSYDLRLFFNFLHDTNSVCNKIPVEEIPISILDKITPMDIEEYLSYLKFYVKDGIEHMNDEKGKMRKLATLRSFYNYYFKKELIEKNPAALVSMPKLHQKNIIRLDVDEVVRLLDEVEKGELLTEKQKSYHKRTQRRDLAIITLLLGTGIRVSECVGIDIDDIDFKNNGIKIRRKGGNEVAIYFGEEVEEALRNYLDERLLIDAKDESKTALFLSLQNKRIGVRAVENLVKKYSKLVTSLKNISPHKLRSTYGTNLYQETGDIYLVADVLGHKDINTTRKHYAAIEDGRRRMAATKVKLRENRE